MWPCRFSLLCALHISFVLMLCQVYCGECTAARSKSRRKGKEPAKSMPMPFKTCVVEGCGKKCSSKTSMLQLFL